ncbi:protein tyrosine phosphatase type IVA 1-like [Acanthaster planci]|uniref:Protein tyrosine phosphatase type IVA 3 n=1 Tax=Acanthaster planci TaxID=133434 RepID=A0A8B7Z735_ACAPL|nr:protein tyrosine phosphatase type IVA 1-like [Acanthaster planci]XP_022101453.1 protein tyrosine phosphatase type IVA 1-like [Acanthaster planci]XP_022101454.1 protein tyrosine phosphatase type IVA 1-like [Acanthaster planci]
MRNYTINMARSVRPAPVEIIYKHTRFLIIHNPDKNGMDYFIKELKKRDIVEVARVCEPTYETKLLENEGIQVLDWAFDDGGVPSNDIIEKWLDLVKKRFSETPGSCVAVHCVAGLGRAPLLVAVALMEAGMGYEDAVTLIREKRRGAINAKQLAFLEKYRSRMRLKHKKNNKDQCCVQ